MVNLRDSLSAGALWFCILAIASVPVSVASLLGVAHWLSCTTLLLFSIANILIFRLVTQLKGHQASAQPRLVLMFSLGGLYLSIALFLASTATLCWKTGHFYAAERNFAIAKLMTGSSGNALYVAQAFDVEPKDKVRAGNALRYVYGIKSAEYQLYMKRTQGTFSGERRAKG